MFFFSAQGDAPPQGGQPLCGPEGVSGAKGRAQVAGWGTGCGWGHDPGEDPFLGALSETVPETEQPHRPPQQTQQSRQLLQTQAAPGQPGDRGPLPGWLSPGAPAPPPLPWMGPATHVRAVSFRAWFRPVASLDTCSGPKLHWLSLRAEGKGQSPDEACWGSWGCCPASSHLP